MSTKNFYISIAPYFASFGALNASFWKRGSFRSGSNTGSSWSSAGVSGTREASAPSDGIDNSFCNAAMARSGSPSCAATLARISIGAGPSTTSFSTEAPPSPACQLFLLALCSRCQACERSGHLRFCLAARTRSKSAMSQLKNIRGRHKAAPAIKRFACRTRPQNDGVGSSSAAP